MTGGRLSHYELEEEIYKAVMGANIFMVHDDNCQAWIARHNVKTGGKRGAGRRSRRRQKRS